LERSADYADEKTKEKRVNGYSLLVDSQGQGKENGWQWIWARDGFDIEKDLCEECLLKLELPLLKDNGQNLGTLWLVKDLKRDTVSHYTLRRIEHLRRTLTSTLTKFQDNTNH